MKGNTGNVYIYEWDGNPTNVQIEALNPPIGAKVIDSMTGNWYRKTSPLNDNSGYELIANGSSIGIFYIGRHSRFVPTGTGVRLETSPDGVTFTPQQSWP